MEAQELFAKLDADFIKPGLSDDWQRISKENLENFYSENFRKRFMGVVLDNTKEIRRIFTAVFPSDVVLGRIINSGDQEALLFLHHPMTWDIRNAPNVFTEISKEQLHMLKERRVSVYALHVPLDNYGQYSTSAVLAEQLGLEMEKPFCPYFGGLAGIIGKSEFETVEELAEKLKKVVGHRVSLYKYGNSEIKDRRVAVVAGGGNDVTALPELVKEGVNTFITGISLLNDYSRAAHDFLEKNRINLLGATHYSTEKFACVKMCDYFKKLGFEAEFIEDDPVMEDL